MYCKYDIEFNKTSNKLKRLINLTIAWVLAGIFFTIIEFLLINPAAQIPNIKYLTTDIHISTYDFLRSMSTTIFGAIVAGLSIGAFEIFYFQDRFQEKIFQLYSIY